MSFTIVCQDITKMEVDVIVNAANSNLTMGSGVCGAIYKAAGIKELTEATSLFAPIKTGEAIITPAFALLAKFIIHTVGPIYVDGKHGEEELLYSAYSNSLKLALDNQCKSIAFPLISSGIYSYPKKEALCVACWAICNFISKHDIDVFLVIFDKATFKLCKKLHGDVARYIDEY